MMYKKKMLYLMHVPWGWIKQRPHFIAENLAEEFEITVCYRRPYRKSKLTKESKIVNFTFQELIVLPFSKFKFIELINTILIRLQIKTNINKYDFVWVTYPALYEYIKDIINDKTQVVYDCMDDALEFPDTKTNLTLKERLESLEKHLFARANVVFSSSDHLKNTLNKRYNDDKNIIVLNNGIDQNKLDNSNKLKSSELLSALDNISLKKVMYIGTISSWIDFDLVKQSLDTIDDIVYIFIGPSEIDPPKHERLLFLPPVEHSQVFDLMSRADVLVMPFIVNDLIKSVNPVKVYEYIYSGKPSIVVRYGETEQFSNYVKLYSTLNEYNNALLELVNKEHLYKYNETLSRCFVMNNTWKERVNKINSTLNTLVCNNHKVIIGNEQ